MYMCPACLQEMEHRIARAGGHRSDDEARALNARITDLSKLLETVSSEHAMLTTQVSPPRVCDPDSLPGRSFWGYCYEQLAAQRLTCHVGATIKIFPSSCR